MTAPTIESRVEEYRTQARQTRQDAELIRDPHLREQLLEIADEYDQLADSLEQARVG